MTPLTEREVLGELQRIERGETEVTCVTPGGWGYCGDVTFHSSSGWIFIVFNDCDSWDYFERIVSPDGRELTFDEIAGPTFDHIAMPSLFNYEPKGSAARAWGIAGGAA